MKIVKPGVKPNIPRHKWTGKEITCPQCGQIIILDDDDDDSPHFVASTSCGSRFWRCTCCEESIFLGTEAAP